MESSRPGANFNALPPLSPQAMMRSGKDFVAIKLLPPGVYQYKFIVDGEWKYAPEQAAMCVCVRASPLKPLAPLESL